jgi:hypothetical protein
LSIATSPGPELGRKGENTMNLNPETKTIDNNPITDGQTLEICFDGVNWIKGTIRTAGEGWPALEYVNGPYWCSSDIREPVQARMN